MEVFSNNDNGSVQQLLTHIGIWQTAKFELVFNQKKLTQICLVPSKIVLVVKYLARLYCVCVIWNSLDTNQIADINFDWSYGGENNPTMIWLRYEKTMSDQTNIDDLIQSSIENGCQVRVDIY